MDHSELSKREENGYRRGFDQAMYITIKMFKEGKTPEELQKIKDEVYQWRYSGKYGKYDVRVKPPVEF